MRVLSEDRETAFVDPGLNIGIANVFQIEHRASDIATAGPLPKHLDVDTVLHQVESVIVFTRTIALETLLRLADLGRGASHRIQYSDAMVSVRQITLLFRSRGVIEVNLDSPLCCADARQVEADDGAGSTGEVLGELVLQVFFGGARLINSDC
jgi:hypothetical protein